MRLFEDILDNDDLFGKRETDVSSVIGTGTDDIHTWPGDPMYRNGMVVEYKKSIRVHEIKALKKELSEFLECQRRITDYSMVCFQNRDYYYIDREIEDGRLRDMKYYTNIWIDFTFNHTFRDTRDIALFVRSLIRFLGTKPNIKFYVNDNQRRRTEIPYKTLSHIISLKRPGSPQAQADTLVELLALHTIFIGNDDLKLTDRLLQDYGRSIV